jgi:hypothetical protein
MADRANRRRQSISWCRKVERESTARAHVVARRSGREEIEQWEGEYVKYEGEKNRPSGLEAMQSMEQAGKQASRQAGKQRSRQAPPARQPREPKRNCTGK